MANRFLVAYDIPDDRRRGKVAALIGSYGDRVQYSVFVVDASPTIFARLTRQLERIADAKEDSILCCDLGRHEGVELDRFIYLGRQRSLTSTASFIL